MWVCSERRERAEDWALHAPRCSAIIGSCSTGGSTMGASEPAASRALRHRSFTLAVPVFDLLLLNPPGIG